MDEMRREAARQIVALLFGLAGTVATVVIIRRANNPDTVRELRMRLALNGKRFAQRQADRWQALADVFATRYNAEKT